jgi:uncharacterized protein YecE (DUF72 family)
MTDGECGGATMQVWIGTSGYSYADWVGEFYPEGTRPERYLAVYARHFPLVELNFTFYRPPTRAILQRLASKAPPGFQFIVKAPQLISHDQRPLEIPGFRDAVEGLQARGQLAGVLAQFPQAMHCTKADCDWVSTLARELGHLKLAVEFRHRSWDRPGLPSWLAEQGVDLVAVDVPDIAALFPRGWVQAGSTAYVRLHSRDGTKWYEDGGYGTTTVTATARWASGSRSWRTGPSRVRRSGRCSCSTTASARRRRRTPGACRPC